MAIAAGEAFGKYRIIEPLGRGGMATVYKAYEPALDRYVALKVLPAEFLHDETFAARFEREAKVIAKLEHPNIIPIFAFGIEQRIPWMAMRYIRGGTLSGLLKSGQVPREQVVILVRAVADALTYAHAGGVVHRDVKPQNILVDERGGVYLADFGIARMIEGGAAITRTGLVSGTPQYMAPEQATGHTTDHRADIYALGVVTYELLTGSTPFSADTPVAVLMKQVSAPIPIPAKELVPESALGPLMKSLAKNPEERWQTAAEFAAALEEGMAVAPVPVIRAASGSTRTIQSNKLPAPPSVRSVSRLAPPAVPASVAAPRAAVSRATPPRAGISPTIAVVVAGLVLLVVAAGLVALWWQRPRVESPHMVTAATLPPATDATEAEAIIPAAPATEVRPELPRPTPSATPAATAVASTVPTPRAGRAAAEPIAVVESMTPPAEAAAQIVPAAAPPAPPAPTSVPPGYAFHVNERTTVETAVGPVHLKSAQFRRQKPDEIEAVLDFYCEKGKDQSVTYEVAFLDAHGAPVLTIKDKKGIEEKDNTTFKKKQKIPPTQLDSIKTFLVTFSSVPD